MEIPNFLAASRQTVSTVWILIFPKPCPQEETFKFIIKSHFFYDGFLSRDEEWDAAAPVKTTNSVDDIEDSRSGNLSDPAGPA